METVISFLIFIFLILIIAVPYWLIAGKKKKVNRQVYEKNVNAGITAPATLHPQIDMMFCIGCGGCVRACPENVLGMVNGKPTIINGARCIGHALCVDACPVAGITMGFGKPKRGMEIPFYDENYQSNIEGLYIIGELGGIGLIRNAFSHGIKAIDHITSNFQSNNEDDTDIAIVGAGPAGVAAALRAKHHKFRSIIFEQDDLGGSILHYPRKKIVLTSPIDLPLYGKLDVSEISKEELLDLFQDLVQRFELDVRTGDKVISIRKDGNRFQISTVTGKFNVSKVVLAIGRRGTPRKLNVPGENLPKVFYRLFEAESFTNKHILVVGGGDSAIEAAVGLARQTGNKVTISYRKEEFFRLKERNEKNIREMEKEKKINVIFQSQVIEIQAESILLEQVNTGQKEIKNDFVFVFAGGELPSEFLKQVGVKLRTDEMEK
ncbi:MAG: NAD(P)-binding domain-containing protein [Ignavibacteriales bacterium]|nr:NAD(P)-binding domain-containing protein [Ignavibacteriales bacterium]